METMDLEQHKVPFDDPDWIYEIKYDGFRSLAYVDSGYCRLVSRNEFGYTRFKNLGKSIPSQLNVDNAILDGEIVCLGDDGRALFYDLMFNRAEPIFAAFDLLWLNGEDLRDLPLLERKSLLEEIFICQSALKNDPLSASKTDPLYSRSYAWLCDERAPERQETWRRRPLSIEGAMIVLAPAPALFEGLRIVAVKRLPVRVSERFSRDRQYLGYPQIEGFCYSRCLKRQLSLPVSTISQWWVSRSSKAVVIFASLNTCGHSAKARLVVTMMEVCSYRRLTRWNSSCPPDSANGR